MNETKIWSVLPTGIPGSVFVILSRYIHKSEYIWTRDCFLVVGIILLATATAVLVVWFAEQIARIYADMRDANDRTYKLAAIARTMNDAQLAFATGARHLGIGVDLAGRTYLHNTDVPMEFVKEFLDRSFNQSACPVRTWNEGTDERRWAQMITNELINSGYATPSAGHYAARWVTGVTPDKIRKILGLQPLPHPALDAPQP